MGNLKGIFSQFFGDDYRYGDVRTVICTWPTSNHID